MHTLSNGYQEDSKTYAQIGEREWIGTVKKQTK